MVHKISHPKRDFEVFPTPDLHLFIVSSKIVEEFLVDREESPRHDGGSEGLRWVVLSLGDDVGWEGEPSEV
jgi:hypothetical protein